MFRSFFPNPKPFFLSAAIWLLLLAVVWLAAGEQVRSFVSIDRYLVAATCEPTAAPSADNGVAATQDTTSGAAPAGTAETPPQAAPTCLPPGTFLTGEKIWEYQYVLMGALIFCLFWGFYQRNRWYWWSVVGSTVILLVIYGSVQVDAWVNDWYGDFYNLLQKALSAPNTVSAAQYYGKILEAATVLVPNIVAQVILLFFTSHYVFRWRSAMNNYYVSYWPKIRNVEGASQRVQEDTMRFADTVEGLGTDFFNSLITLAVFLPILWGLSDQIKELPIIGAVPGSLVWVALLSAVVNTILLAGIGIKLPGLSFEIQKTEAAYRKELVYGEDHAERAEPRTLTDLFKSVRWSYFRLYWHYTYFNVARYFYIQAATFLPYLAMGPAVIKAVITFGLFQQILTAFGQVSASFRFFASSWTTIVNLLSVYRRLRLFEASIPREIDAASLTRDLTPAPDL